MPREQQRVQRRPPLDQVPEPFESVARGDAAPHRAVVVGVEPAVGAAPDRPERQRSGQGDQRHDQSRRHPAALGGRGVVGGAWGCRTRRTAERVTSLTVNLSLLERGAVRAGRALGSHVGTPAVITPSASHIATHRHPDEDTTYSGRPARRPGAFRGSDHVMPQWHAPSFETASAHGLTDIIKLPRAAHGLGRGAAESPGGDRGRVAGRAPTTSR